MGQSEAVVPMTSERSNDRVSVLNGLHPRKGRRKAKGLVLVAAVPARAG